MEIWRSRLYWLEYKYASNIPFLGKLSEKLTFKFIHNKNNMKTIAKIVWSEIPYLWFFMTQESRDDIEEILIENLWKEFVKLFRVNWEGIVVRYDEAGIINRKNAGYITKIKYPDNEFDFSKHKKKYLWLKEVWEKNVKINQQKVDRKKAIIDFKKTIKCDEVSIRERYDRLEFRGNTIELIVDNDGKITDIHIAYSVSSTYSNSKIDDDIKLIQDIKQKQIELSKMLVGKNVFNKMPSSSMLDNKSLS